MSITLHIQLRSKVEMPFEDAIDYIQNHFPGFLTSTGGGYSPREGLVHLDFRQDALSDEQRDWLHLSPFSAVYIDGYTVEKDTSQKQVQYRTQLPLTLVFDQDDVDSQEEADRYIVSLSFEIAGVLHREFDGKGLRQVRVSNVESEERENV